jgi:Lrp/AsnC family transcriptional regulator for asnA, asnC and gidA
VRGQPTLVHGVDEVGKRLVEELQQDGRRSYAALAKAVGLSEAAVRQRVQRMVDSGLMQVVAVTDPLQVGFHRQAMIGLRVEGDLVRVADELAEIDEVDYVVITAGSFDILLELVCEDDDHLLRLLCERIQRPRSARRRTPCPRPRAITCGCTSPACRRTSALRCR